MRRVAAVGLLLACATAARAEIYRCDEPGGGVRFTSDRSACARPVAHDPDRARVSIAPAAPSPPAPSVPSAPPGTPAPGALDAIFPPPPSRAWEVLSELPEAPDDQERALGLIASVARHYTHARGSVSEVCTVEVWAFARSDQAEGARAEVARPTWWGRTAGSLLVLAHGVRLEREVGSREGLVAGCASLAEAAHARALATLAAGGAVP